MTVVVEYVLSGHRFKLFVTKETCNIAFSFSSVRCPGRDEPYSNEAIALMRRKIMQRDVEVISLTHNQLLIIITITSFVNTIFYLFISD